VHLVTALGSLQAAVGAHLAALGEFSFRSWPLLCALQPLLASPGVLLGALDPPTVLSGHLLVKTCNVHEIIEKHLKKIDVYCSKVLWGCFRATLGP
jgi:hypothetical protein